MFTSNTSKPTYKTIAMSALATLFFCGATLQPAFAETKTKDIVAGAPAADADFKKLDANSDAKISLKEAVKDKTLATSFDMTDANKDGNISADEYVTYKAAAKLNSPEAVPAANPVN